MEKFFPEKYVEELAALRTAEHTCNTMKRVMQSGGMMMPLSKVPNEDEETVSQMLGISRGLKEIVKSQLDEGRGASRYCAQLLDSCYKVAIV